MGRKRKGNPINGWINFDKPLGMTSTQAVGKVRWLFQAQKAGHAGTLDPLATGILPIALGEATKTINFVQDSAKIYSFTVGWGQQRDTDDNEGDVIATSDVRPTEVEITALLPRYTGDIEQTPPKFSAIKIDGKRAYDLARDGKDVELKSRIVHIESLELVEMREGEADFITTCGKGTYIRSLARDMALDLGTYGYIKVLRRERVGVFDTSNALTLDRLEEMDHSAPLVEVLHPLQTVLDDIPALALKEDESAKLRCGQKLAFVSRPDFKRLEDAGFETGHGQTQMALASHQGDPVALVEIQGPEVKPVRVFNCP